MRRDRNFTARPRFSPHPTAISPFARGDAADEAQMDRTTMAKPEWGVKRLCPNCSTRFYDLLQAPIVCPACGTSFPLEAFTKPRRGKAAAKAAAPKVVVEELVVEDEEDTVAEDDPVLDLGDDEDDGEALPERKSGGESDEEEPVIADFTEEPMLDEDTETEDEEDDVSLDALGEEESNSDDEDEDGRDDR